MGSTPGSTPGMGSTPGSTPGRGSTPGATLLAMPALLVQEAEAGYGNNKVKQTTENVNVAFICKNYG